MDAKPAWQPQPAVYDALQHKVASELGQDEEEVRPSLLARIESLLVGGLAIVALALCTYNVVVRYFHPVWTLEMVDEVQVYVIVWAVFIALGAVTIADRHVKADLFVSFFPPRLRLGVEIFIDLLGLGFALMLLWYGGLPPTSPGRSATCPPPACASRCGSTSLRCPPARWRWRSAT